MATQSTKARLSLLPEISAFCSPSPKKSSSKKRRGGGIAEEVVHIASADFGKNPQLYKIGSVCWTRALLLLNASDLCRFAKTCKYAHLEAQRALVPQFTVAPYSGRHGPVFSDIAYFGRAFNSLKKENLQTHELIQKYWSKRTELCLSVFSYQMPGSPPDDKDLKAIATHCTSLKRLSFSYATCGMNGHDELAAMIQAASKTLQECRFVEVYPAPTTLAALLSCKALESLKIIEELRPGTNPNTLGRNEVLLQILTSGIKLTSFTQTAWELTVPVLEAIAEHQTGLTDLSIGCKKVQNITPPQQIVLQKAYFDSLEKGLIATILKLPKLTCLGLSQPGCPMPNWDSTYVTDETLVAITKACRELRQLSLINCSKVTRMGIQALRECSHLQNLIVTQDDGSELFKKGMSLIDEETEIMDLNQGIDDEALQALATSAPGLKNLTIVSRCITAKGVSSLSACTKLRTLSLNGCKNVVLGDLLGFLKALPPELNFIDLRGISPIKLSEEAIPEFNQAIFNLPASFVLETDAGTYRRVNRTVPGKKEPEASMVFTQRVLPEEWD